MKTDNANQLNDYPFLQGGGEMGSLIRSIDWSAGDLKDPGQWPTGLKHCISMMLANPLPVLICWGDDYIQFYNDAFRPILGQSKHPQAMGISASVTYGEIWHTIGTMFEGVMSGTAVSFPDFMVSLDRNGAPEDCYFDFSYSPIRDEQGKPCGVLVICMETTDKVLALRQLKVSQENTENMIRQAPVGMCTLLGPEHVIMIANPVIIELWGKPEADVMYKPVFDALPDARAQGLEQVMKDVYESGHTFEANEMPVNLIRNGVSETVYQDFVYEPYRDNHGRIIGIIAITIDVTQQVLARQKVEESERELLHIKQQLETELEAGRTLQRQKDEFLSIASHELKTPLTSIKLFNQLLLRAAGPEKMLEFAQRTVSHVQRLERLISDLLDVTKINSGKMPYHFEAFDFRQMLLDCIEPTQHAAKHQLILSNAPEITYTGDRARLEQVINNLLVNAIKYSPEADRVVINSFIDGGNIIVTVQDFGIGIAPEDIDKLFDRYYRVDNTAMRFDGLGLGLFISSEILKRHQGTLWIESEAGKGSIFCFSLPLSNDEQFKALIREDDRYKDNYITITYDNERGLLDVDWTGFQNMASVQHGCMLMLEYLAKHGCDRVINNNTRVRGNWSEAVDWVGNTWFPMMEQAGTRYFAHIFSPSTFSQLSARKSIDIMAGIITTQYFTDYELAMEWINRFPR
jgi:signal transduction histidine kinase